MDKAWNFILDNFFSHKTNLLYDFLVRDCEDILVGHLPSPAEINLQIPNPCGWGTGMEDSVLSAGSLLDAVVARYNVTKDKSLYSLTDNLFDGMMRCVVDIDSGFIARSVSPVDGKSFYYDTSRDQYTHWVYAALRLYNSELATKEHKENIRKVLVAVAKRMELNVTFENDYNFLRYDNKTSIAGKMAGELGCHEYLRLPFFYAAAWYVSRDNHWFDMYMVCRDDAFGETISFDAKKYGNRCYPVLQMQYSLRALYDIDPDLDFKNNVLYLLNKVAESYSDFAPKMSKNLCENIDAPENYYQYRPWNKVRMLYNGYIGERVYFNPAQSEMKENRGFYNIRNVGEAVSILALCPNYKFGEEQYNALKNLCDAIDYTKICNYSPMLLACGWWLLKEAELQK